MLAYIIKKYFVSVSFVTQAVLLGVEVYIVNFDHGGKYRAYIFKSIPDVVAQPQRPSNFSSNIRFMGIKMTGMIP